MRDDNRNLVMVLEVLVKETAEEMESVKDTSPMRALNLSYRLDRQKQALETAKALTGEQL